MIISYGPGTSADGAAKMRAHRTECRSVPPRWTCSSDQQLFRMASELPIAIWVMETAQNPSARRTRQARRRKSTRMTFWAREHVRGRAQSSQHREQATT